LAFASLLLVGLCFWRRAPRVLMSILITVGVLAGLAGMSACGAGATLTPGTYAYTITASQVGTTGTPVTASTTINVTVPGGISTNLGPS